MSVSFQPENLKYRPSYWVCQCVGWELEQRYSQAALDQLGELEKRELAEAANAECRYCKGTGVEEIPEPDGPFINWCNANAEALLAAMGRPADDLCGALSVPEARRMVMRGRNRGSVSAFTRADECGDRFYSMGLGEDDIQARLATFGEFVEECAAYGAEEIVYG